MPTVVKNSDDTYTITLDTDEKVVVGKAEIRYGANIVEELIGNWIEDRKRVLEGIEAEEFGIRFRALSIVNKKKVENILGGRA